MNLLEAHAMDGKAQIGEFIVPVDEAAARKIKSNANITVGVRPEAWRIVSENAGDPPVQNTVVAELGSDAFAYGASGVAGTPSNTIIRIHGRDKVHKRETIHVTNDPHHVHVFDTDTGERLSD